MVFVLWYIGFEFILHWIPIHQCLSDIACVWSGSNSNTVLSLGYESTLFDDWSNKTDNAQINTGKYHL